MLAIDSELNDLLYIKVILKLKKCLKNNSCIKKCQTMF